MMLFRLEKLFGASVAAPEGEIGRVEDVYFDDRHWTVCYLVVDTGNPLTGGKVLIASISVRSIDWERNLVHTGGGHGPAPIDAHLRSLKEVAGYQLLTSYDSVGLVEDFILDNETWAIRYLVIDTSNWLPDKRVVIPPQWISGVEWLERVVNVEVSRNSVQTAPEYHPALDLSRLHETNLYSHYQRPAYWQ